MYDLPSTRLLAGACILALLLGGCATPPQTRALPEALPAGLPARVELHDTPFHPQERYQCGPAALATVLGAHGIEVTPAELVDAVYVPALKGSLPEELAATARRHGMLAYPLRPSLADLLEETAQGNPVVVFQNLGTGWLPRWHFAVVVGYDLPAGEIILRSGTTERWRTTLANFERTWSRSDYWALVVLPPGRIPASARLERHLQAAHDLENAGRAVAAGEAWRAATRHWPDEPRAHLALGNSRYAAADYPRAASAFHTAARLDPVNPQAWNNLAYALLQTACPQQAVAAATCAARLAADDENYRDTLAEITNRARGADAAHCPALDCPAVAP